MPRRWPPTPNGQMLVGNSHSNEVMRARIVEAAVKPGRRRIKANARRLRHRKRL